MSHLSERAHTWSLFCALLAIASLVLFVRLGNGDMEVYDEGLYGMYARNALHHHAYLHAIDEAGGFATGAKKFSKPPMSIWVVAASMHVLGPSLFAMRLPFALATLVIACLLFAWGRELAPGRAGTWLGFVTALLWLSTEGVHHWGRTATIEPLLLAFVMLALFSYARARRAPGARAWLWSILSALAICGAFLTKQVVCVLAVLPVALSEVAALRVHAKRFVLRRLALTIVPAMLLAAGWGLAVVQRVGAAAREVLVEHALLDRVAGYDGLHHKNYLNRVIDQLDKDAAPLSWQLGMVGLALCVSTRFEQPHRKVWGWLMAGMLCVAWLAFDVGSRSILPWYVLTFVPPIVLGNAWLIHSFWQVAAATVGSPTPDLRALVGAAAGVLALVHLVCSAAGEFTSAMLAAGVFVSALAWWLHVRELEREPGAEAGELRSLTIVRGMFVAVAVVLCISVGAKRGFRNTEADPLSTLGEFAQEHGARRVSLDTSDKTHVYRRLAFLGSTAEMGAAPWTLDRPHAGRFDARVEFALVPSELTPRKGVALGRAGGSHVTVGDMTRPPFATDLESLLDSGRDLTFEAEHMASERRDTLRRVAELPSRLVRRFAPRHREKVGKFYLAHGATAPLPAGTYQVTFWGSVRCGGFSRERVGVFKVMAQGRSFERPIDCARLPALEGEFGKFVVEARWSKPTVVHLSARYDQGHIALDRITFRRNLSP